MKAHSDGFARYGFDYRVAYFSDVDRKYYRLKISVGINEDGKEAYNIGDIKNIGKTPSNRFKDQKGASPTSSNIPQNDTSVNTYSTQNSEKVAQNSNKNVGKNDKTRFSASKTPSISDDESYTKESLTEPVTKIVKDLEKVKLRAELRNGKKVYSTKDAKTVLDSIMNNLTFRENHIFFGKKAYETNAKRLIFDVLNSDCNR